MDCKCFQCGSSLIHKDTWTASDIGLISPDNTDGDDEFVVYLMDCPVCGVSYEVAECPPSEKINYDYYNKQE